MLILIEDGELYDPVPRGRQSLLIANGCVEKVGRVDRRALDALGVEHEVIDASGCAVVPGFIDPHQHLLGGSGEGSLALQSPEMFLREIVRAGITGVVGTLGALYGVQTSRALEHFRISRQRIHPGHGQDDRGARRGRRGAGCGPGEDRL